MEAGSVVSHALATHQLRELRALRDGSSGPVVDASAGRGGVLSTVAYPRLRVTYSMAEIVQKEKERKAAQQDSRGLPLSSYFFPGSAAGPGTKKDIEDVKSCYARRPRDGGPTDHPRST